MNKTNKQSEHNYYYKSTMEFAGKRFYYKSSSHLSQFDRNK